MKNNILKLIGVWLAIDGIASFVYFQAISTPFAQLTRIIRTVIGVYLICYK